MGFYEELDKNNYKYIIYEHPKADGPERTHIHGLLLNVGHSTDTLKNWVKKALNVKTYKRTDWSFVTEYKDKQEQKVYKITDESIKGLIKYMSKGRYEPMRNTAYDDEFVMTCKAMWVHWIPTVKESGTTQVEVEVVTRSKKTKNELMAEVALMLIQRGFSDTNRESPSDIIRAVVQVLKVNRIVTNMYKMADYVDTFLAWHRGDTFVETLENYYIKSRYRT